VELLEMRDDPNAMRGDVREKAKEKIAAINSKISDLMEMRDALAALLSTCKGNEPAAKCPIIKAF
jgi:MerR family transcriptional regulator, copper efflux regulator